MLSRNFTSRHHEFDKFKCASQTIEFQTQPKTHEKVFLSQSLKYRIMIQIQSLNA